jgi:hypothetical protein
VLNGKLQWLDGSNPRDLIVWENIWEKSAARRPHDHPGYLHAMKAPHLFPMALIFKYPGGGTIFYPFYLEPLNDLDFVDCEEVPLYHMISPYGYGGPIYEGPGECREIVCCAFETALQAELHKRGIISEFIREDLFQDRLAERKCGEHIEKQSNVIVSLEQSEDELWRKYKTKVRSSVLKAREAGLKVVFDTRGQYLDDFIAIYLSTMERKGASEGYFFTRECFQSLTRAFSAMNALTYVHVFLDKRIISTELVLLSPDTAYFFLGGSVNSEYDKKPNYLLKHEIILWAKRQGLKYYVLGGGVKPGDGIYQYKKAFAPDSLYPFFVRQIIYDAEKYVLLTRQRELYEKNQGIEWRPENDFFPAYLSGRMPGSHPVISLKAGTGS